MSPVFWFNNKNCEDFYIPLFLLLTRKLDGGFEALDKTYKIVLTALESSLT